MADNPLKAFLASTQLAADNGPSQTRRQREQDGADTFWSHEEIDATRWNQLFPYQFTLVKRGPDGKYSQDELCRLWTLTLPFPPESISIGMPFAIRGSVTQGGYVEEHAGAPVRPIQLAGTFGVLPLRGASPNRQEQNVAEAIFAGTLQQTQRLATAGGNLAGVLGFAPATAPNLVAPSSFQDPDAQGNEVARTSGYFQARVFMEFFENYVAFKQKAAGRDYRLALAMFKDQAVYLVTPLDFPHRRDASSPLEYRYSVSLRAWKRISLSSIKAVGASAYTPSALRPNAMQQVLNLLSDAREVLINAREVLMTVGGDIDRTLFEPLRQVHLFLKDALSVPLAFADLPVQVLNDCRDAILQYVSTRQAFEGASEQFKDEAGRVREAYRSLAAAGSRAGTVEVGVARSAGTVGTASTSSTDAAFDVFRHPEQNYAFFAGIKPSQVSVPAKATAAIVREREATRKLKRASFEAIRDNVVQALADFEAQVGAGNAVYDATFSRPAVITTRTPTDTDFEVIFALNQLASQLDRLAASGTIDQRLRSVDFVAGLATQAGIAFKVPRSKFAVPFPYGASLELLAQRYLHDPDRWVEIAALNGLRAPYVDEEGFELPLLTNGSGNQVTVADASGLHVAQAVWLNSTNSTTSMRRVTAIQHISDSYWVVTLDGDSDLGRFTLAGKAQLHAFLPDTVNSMQQIYIPSDRPADLDPQTRDVPGINAFDELVNATGFDLLLDPKTNDIVLTPDGDQRWAVGLANITQTARIRLSTVQGTLLNHPEFGLPVTVGQSLADFDAKSLLKAVKNLFIDDPAFTGVQYATVRAAGPVVAVSLGVGIRGATGIVPLTFDVAR